MSLRGLNRKMKHNSEFELRAERAFQALKGERDDVYPCREDIPAELWGEFIQDKPGELAEWSKAHPC